MLMVYFKESGALNNGIKRRVIVCVVNLLWRGPPCVFFLLLYWKERCVIIFPTAMDVVEKYGTAVFFLLPFSPHSFFPANHGGKLNALPARGLDGSLSTNRSRASTRMSTMRRDVVRAHKCFVFIRHHTTFVSDAEFRVIFPEFSETRIVAHSLLNPVGRRIDSTERYESNRWLPSLRSGVSARPHVTLLAKLVACKHACWHGRLGRMLVRLAGRRLKVSLPRRIVCARGLGLHTRRGGKLFRRSVLEAAAHVERARRGPESLFLPQLRVIEAMRKGNETGRHTCSPPSLCDVYGGAAACVLRRSSC